VQHVVKKAGENLYEQQQKQQQQYTNTAQKESPLNQRPKEKKKVGEYIDFEEID